MGVLNSKENSSAGRPLWVVDPKATIVANEVALIAILERQGWRVLNCRTATQEQVQAATGLAGRVGALAVLVAAGMTGTKGMRAVAYTEADVSVFHNHLKPNAPNAGLVTAHAVLEHTRGGVRIYWRSLSAVLRGLEVERGVPAPIIMQRGTHAVVTSVAALVERFQVDRLVQFGFGNGRIFGELPLEGKTVVDPHPTHDIGAFDGPVDRVFEIPANVFLDDTERAAAGLYLIPEPGDGNALVHTLRLSLESAPADALWCLGGFNGPEGAARAADLLYRLPGLKAAFIGPDGHALLVLWRQMTLGGPSHGIEPEIAAKPPQLAIGDLAARIQAGWKRRRAMRVRAREDQTVFEARLGGAPV